MPVTTTQRSWIELVNAADPDFAFESQHPEVYRWGGGKRKKRDPGAQGGPYANNAVVQQVYVTEDASKGFTTEDGEKTFVSEVKG